MGKDRVMHPVNQEGKGGIKSSKSAIVEGPTPTADNLNAYNRKKK